MRRFVVILAVLACGIPLLASAQLETGDYDYSSEWIYGIGKNTRGGLIGHGFIRHARAYDFPFFNNRKGKNLLSEGGFIFGQFEIGNIKHEQEFRFVQDLGRNFVYGKSNYLYAFRFMMGAEKVVFRKGPKQGVQISISYALGPSFGYTWPYYVEVATNCTPQFCNSTFEAFDAERHPIGSILGPGRPLQGFNEGSLYPGLAMKAAVNIEFGTFKSSVSGFDVGFANDFYFQEIPIVETADNRASYPMAFISLYFGTRR